MLYYLLYPLHEIFSVANLLRYITVRSIGAAVTGFLLMLIFGPSFQNWLKKLQFNQNIRSDGPESHQAKQGTPTMGGLLIFGVFGFSALLWSRLDNSFVQLLFVGTFAFVLIGFVDDLICVVGSGSKGLSGKFRLMLELAIVALVITTLRFNVDWSTELWVPFVKSPQIDIGWFYILFAFLVVGGTSNGVNLTDGLDGLATGVSLPVLGGLAILTYAAGHVQIARYLMIFYSPEAGELTVLVSALTGSLLGFLWYNAHPATMFMGDTGALGIGGFIGLTAVFIKQELLLPILCGVFLFEVLSVIVQVGSFKFTGKRVFKMAPLHHHFELSGWTENKVIIRFWIIGILFALLGLASVKVR